MNINEPFVLEEYYHTPAEHVWQALTDVNAMKVWYFPQLKSFQPVVGFEMQFYHDGSAYQKRWEVSQVVTGKKLAHSWSYVGYTGLSEVTFELFPDRHCTMLKLTHTGLATFPNDPHFAPHRFEQGWQQIISYKLKEYLTPKTNPQ